MFQYISCYSLSERSFRPGKCYHVSIHLMLLFIRLAERASDFVDTSFNTSHVTLYRGYGTYSFCGVHVSIHLMLLFITLEEIKQKYTELFQYISCYSLSPGGKNCRILLFVSIHLMLLFIVLRILIQLHSQGFNTSHVTLYQQTEMLNKMVENSFNTSHVTLYQCPGFHAKSWLNRFNTSHVTLYQTSH